MNSGIKRRLEKLEGRLEFMKTKANERQAKLAEIKRLEGQDSLRAALLRLELEYGRPFTLVDMIAMAGIEQTKDCSET